MGGSRCSSRLELISNCSSTRTSFPRGRQGRWEDSTRQIQILYRSSGTRQRGLAWTTTAARIRPGSPSVCRPLWSLFTKTPPNTKRSKALSARVVLREALVRVPGFGASSGSRPACDAGLPTANVPPGTNTIWRQSTGDKQIRCAAALSEGARSRKRLGGAPRAPELLIEGWLLQGREILSPHWRSAASTVAPRLLLRRETEKLLH